MDELNEILRAAQEASNQEELDQANQAYRDFLIEAFGEDSQEFRDYLILRTPPVIRMRPDTFKNRVENERSNFMNQLVPGAGGRQENNFEDRRNSIIGEIGGLLQRMANQ